MHAERKAPMEIRAIADDVVAEATGRSQRADPTVGTSGGPAGNARLTAWTGLILLILFGAELLTLVDVRSLISWHVLVGVVLIPPALLKTSTTGWRIVRYYSGSRPYRTAGPPPLVLRILGPLVIIATLGVLGSGLALILMNPETGRQPWIAGVSVLMLHKGMFVIWGVVTGLHTLGRLVPAWRLTGGTRAPVPGGGRRGGAVLVTLAAACVAGALALSLVGPWRDAQPSDHFRHRPTHSMPR
jgi:hypothetical protein